MKFVTNWKHIMLRAYSVRWWALGTLLGTVGIALPQFSVEDPAISNYFIIASVVCTLLGGVARFIDQEIEHDSFEDTGRSNGRRCSSDRSD